MESAQNNSQILAFINAQMQSGINNQLNNEEQAKMIETLKQFQKFINQQDINSDNNKQGNKDNNIKENEDIKGNNNYQYFPSILDKIVENLVQN